MADQWFVRGETEDLGPYRPSEILQLIWDGVVREETMLRKGDSAWTPAGDVGGLFEAAARPTVRWTCPRCGRDVRQPPTYCRRCDLFLERANRSVTEHTVPARPVKGSAAAHAGKPTSGGAPRPLSRLFRRK